MENVSFVGAVTRAGAAAAWVAARMSCKRRARRRGFAGRARCTGSAQGRGLNRRHFADGCE